ncbi:HAD family phosphatase [Telmatobacter sp. DSM 110680]|uniref:HAD family phosphatase n=1 Tax=Telmatobacter sp. DSM 110680 TaxID=3036704 RepID=A0AAU7DDU3_9BACT
MALRAVIFDYGMVLTGQPSAAAHDAMLRITGLPHDRFEAIYWADRHAYDEGKLTGLQFWQNIVRDAKLNLDANAIDELNLWDARMWTTQNPAMLAWQQQLKQHGIRTAILSNMGDTVLANIEREFDWLPRFDVLVWSYQHNMAKPDPAIYQLTLDRLGTRPGESLFIDDKQPNIDAARALGMVAIQFSTIEKLRKDLLVTGLDKDLPLPELTTTHPVSS